MAINQMPHNLEAEQALLGCILFDESVQADILEQLQEDDFYQESHRLVLNGMKAVYADHRVVDLVTLRDKLASTGTLERVGGVKAISDLSEAVPSAANYREYFSIVRRDSVNRALIRAAHDIIEHSTKSPEEKEAVDYAERVIYGISQNESKGDLASIAESGVLAEVIHKFETIQEDKNAYRGVETGFRRLDDVTHGLQKGNLIIIAARPGIGKSSLAMNIIEHACTYKDNVAAVFSLEMPYVEIAQRLLCAHAGVSMESALSARLKQSDWKNLLRAGDRLNRTRIFVDDSSRISATEMLSKLRRLKRARGRLDLVMIDYIQLMKGESAGKDFNRQQEVAGISRDLKLMAKELDVPVIALSQLRRIETKEAQLSDLRESGAIEQDADIVMFINRPDVGATPEEIMKKNIVKGAADLVIAKHRNGALARIPLRFIEASTKFVDVESQDAPTEEQSRVVAYGDEDMGIPVSDDDDTGIPVDDE